MEEEFYKKLGEMIRMKRKMMDFSQDYMAAKLEISQNVYSRIEAGRVRPSVFKLNLICKLLGIDINNIGHSEE